MVSSTKSSTRHRNQSNRIRSRFERLGNIFPCVLHKLSTACVRENITVHCSTRHYSHLSRPVCKSGPPSVSALSWWVFLHILLYPGIKQHERTSPCPGLYWNTTQNYTRIKTDRWRSIRAKTRLIIKNKGSARLHRLHLQGIWLFVDDAAWDEE